MKKIRFLEILKTRSTAAKTENKDMLKKYAIRRSKAITKGF